jgi:hypothetical protein
MVTASLLQEPITELLSVIIDPKPSVVTAAHAEINKEFAYVVVPVVLSFERNGTQVMDKGILTVTLKNETSGWRITGWVWSDQ